MKRIVSLMLIVCMMLIAIPASAKSPGNVIQPYGSLSLRGGMVYDYSEESHYIHGQCGGATELKTITVTIYRQEGSNWVYVDSVSNSGYTSTVSTGKHVAISSGIYRVDVRGTTHNSDGTIPYYYDIK